MGILCSFPPVIAFLILMFLFIKLDILLVLFLLIVIVSMEDMKDFEFVVIKMSIIISF